jgi:hypothetical protein
VYVIELGKHSLDVRRNWVGHWERSVAEVWPTPAENIHSTPRRKEDAMPTAWHEHRRILEEVTHQLSQGLRNSFEFRQSILPLR